MRRLISLLLISPLILEASAALAASTASGTYKLEVSPKGRPAAVSIDHAVALRTDGSFKIYLFSQPEQNDPLKADLNVELGPKGPMEKPIGFKSATFSYPKRIVHIVYYNNTPLPATANGYPMEQGKMLISDWVYESGMLHCALKLDDVTKDTPKMASHHSLNCRIDCPVRKVPTFPK